MSREPALDLSRYHFKRELGELTLYGTWVRQDGEDEHEPCLVIIPTFRKSGFKPCVVALNSCWQYNPEHNGHRFLAHQSRRFLWALGMEDCMSNAHKVADLINSHLGDLVRMPNNPTRAVVVADATYTVDGVKRSIELLDHKPLAQA